MLGRRLAQRIVDDGRLAGSSVSQLTLLDVQVPDAPQHAPESTQCAAVDIAEPGALRPFIEQRPDVVYHLAAIVSGDAEANFDKGYRINLDGTRQLFEAIRAVGDGYCPRVVYSSSVAVFGAPFPDVIGDDFHQTPLTSYGVQKAAGELLLADCTRRGILDGIGLRLPTICIRPGTPNLAASGFFSNILREPLMGKPAVLPVPDTVRHWFASPRAAIEFLVHAAGLDGDRVGPRRSLNLPGLSATVAEMIEALGRAAGSDAVGLIRREADPAIQAIVGNWAERFDPQRALALGFRAESSFDEIIQVHLEDEAVV